MGVENKVDRILEKEWHQNHGFDDIMYLERERERERHRVLQGSNRYSFGWDHIYNLFFAIIDQPNPELTKHFDCLPLYKNRTL